MMRKGKSSYARKFPVRIIRILGRVQGDILKESLMRHRFIKPCTYPIYMNLGKV